MTTRTTSRTVHFRNAFSLAGIDGPLPAGAYVVDTDEKRLEGVSFSAYLRVATFVRVPPSPGRPGLAQIVPVDPAALDAALGRDRDSATGASDTLKIAVAPGEAPAS